MGTAARPAPHYRDLLRRVSEQPGVSAAALSDFTPFWTAIHTDPVTALEGIQAHSDINAQAIAVTDQFTTLGISSALRRGLPAPGCRAMAAAGDHQPVARRSAGRAATHRGHIRVGESGPCQQPESHWYIAGNAHLGPRRDPADTNPLAVYVDLWQFANGRRTPTLLAKGAAAAELRRAVQAGGRDYIQRFTTLAAQKDQALVENQWLAWLSEIFGGLTLALAATGLFGLLSCHHVASRTGEIGLRMALGAQRRAIHSLILRQIVAVMATGIAAGLALAVALARLLASMVFGVSVYDARLLAASVVVLIATALCAAWIPARRAASLDPLAALRQD